MSDVCYVHNTDTAGGSDLEYCMGIEVPLLLCLEHVPCVALPRHEPLKELQRGQLLDGMYRRPYWADIADLRYAQAFNATLLALSNKFIREGPPRPLPPTRVTRLRLKNNLFVLVLVPAPRSHCQHTASPHCELN